MASDSGGTVPTGSPRTKICGITRPTDAKVAEQGGASCVGVILVPDTPRFISTERAAKIARAVTIPVVVVVIERDAGTIARLAESVGAGIIQLHGERDPETFRAVRKLGPWELWGAARVRSGDEALGVADELREVADLVLLDGWHPSRIGGTGRAFPWAEVERLREAWPPALGLGAAGGLTPDNVEEAIRRLRPHLVDVSSGVEMSPGVKDAQRVRSFLTRARTAWNQLGGPPKSGEPPNS